MKKSFLLLSLLLPNVFFLKAAQPAKLSDQEPRKAYVIPIYYDGVRKEWIALFGQYKDSNEWVPFRNNVYDKPWKYAAIALHNLTNGLYNLDENREPNYRLIPNADNTDRDFLYFAPVKYISAAELERNNQTIRMKKFVWLPLDLIVTSPKVIKFSNNSYLIPQEIQNAIKHYWIDDIKPILQPQEEPEEPLIPRRKRPTASAQEPSTSQPEITHWLGHAGAKYLNDEPFNELSILFHDQEPLIINGITWKSAAHYFEAQKFKNNRALYDRIKDARIVQTAYEIAKSNKDKIDNDWDDRAIATLFFIMHGKINNDLESKDTLELSDNSLIIDDSEPADEFYGIGRSGEGQNQLGQMLMRIRDELNGKVMEDAPYYYYNSAQDYFSKRNYHAFFPKMELKGFGTVRKADQADVINIPGCASPVKVVGQKSEPQAASSGAGPHLSTLLKQLASRLEQLLIALT